ncbi:replication-association protein [Cyclovirus Chimp12]|nr:replication-association protein [Cyclovirus Chimp12]
MSNRTVRKFCFTWNNYEFDAYAKCETFLNNFAKYGSVGEELCPSTGTPHLQGYVNLIKPTRFSTIKKHLHNAIHIEKANGSDEQNQTYCRKSGIFFEKGEPIKQGQRTDLQLLVKDTMEPSNTLKDIATKHPIAYIRYFRGIQELRRMVLPVPPRNYPTEVRYYWGPPGSGKSRRALQEATEISTNGIYYKPRGQWWDGYVQQSCVIIDDFYGWIKYDEILKICDRYPYKVQIKGGYEEFTSTHIWFTSNVDTDLLYKFNNYINTAFERRITVKEHITLS